MKHVVKLFITIIYTRQEMKENMFLNSSLIKKELLKAQKSDLNVIFPSNIP